MRKLIAKIKKTDNYVTSMECMGIVHSLEIPKAPPFLPESFTFGFTFDDMETRNCEAVVSVSGLRALS
jgi:hypothetical protein